MLKIDDHSRIAFTAMLPNEKAISSASFLQQAVAYFARLGIVVRRVMTDNGPCFCANLFAQTCRELQLKHIRTHIYTPRTNGKAERFIQTAIRDWPTPASIKTPPNGFTGWFLGLTNTTGIALMPASLVPGSMLTTSCKTLHHKVPQAEACAT